MYCDHCGKQLATTHVKKTVNGKTTEMHLCAQCAAQQGLSSAFGGFGFDLGDFWGSLFSEPTQRVQENEQRCPDCGSDFREIAQQGRPGCPTCYLTFYDRLLPSIQRIHGKTQHTGKVAAQADDTVKKEHKLKELRDQLNACIAKQDYETCATLRDQIRELEEKGEA